MKTKILVVDDEPGGRSVFRAWLEREGYSVRAACDVPAALAAAGKSRPDLVLADVALPGTDGFELCRILRADPRTTGIPVILMSGVRRDEEAQAAGMDLGADDYLVKPFTPRLLSAKVRAVLRRFAAPAELGEALKSRGLALDVESRKVRVKDRDVALTRKEFDLLAVFLRARGRVLRVPFLLESVWGYDPAEYNDPHTVEVHLSSLRRKLGKPLGRLIASVPGVGYRFDG